MQPTGTPRALSGGLPAPSTSPRKAPPAHVGTKESMGCSGRWHPGACNSKTHEVGPNAVTLLSLCCWHRPV
eukprot:15467122-Alexandrium_andersonii.AAC.1